MNPFLTYQPDLLEGIILPYYKLGIFGKHVFYNRLERRLPTPQDPEDPVRDDEMIQCVVCEDWYHGRHLGMDRKDVPEGDSYAEMVCVGCVTKHPFLMAYAGHAVTKVARDSSAEAAASAEVNVSANESNLTLAGSFISAPDDEEKPKQPKEEEEPPKPASECSVAQYAEGSLPPRTLFLAGSWRKVLCPCVKCRDRLAERRLDFLPNLEDTVHHYEAQSKEEQGEDKQLVEIL